ncbi:putative FRG domain-containing protein [Alteromonas macleodii]
MEQEIFEYNNLSDFFSTFPTHFLKNQYTLVYRGMQNSDWKLESTLYRYMQELKLDVSMLNNNWVSEELNSKTAHSTIENMLIESLKLNVGINNDLPDSITNDFDELKWLQYGQHYGLPSPLLDWTKSPYVALYFALQNQQKEAHSRALWTLNTDMLGLINTLLEEQLYSKNQFYQYTIPIQSLLTATDTYSVNKRIAYQLGLFTREYRGITISDWYSKAVKALDITLTSPLLQKHIWVDNLSERIEYLQVLDRMNINSRVLFPDIEGSVKQTKENVLWALIGERSKDMTYKTNSDDKIHYETHIALKP